MHSYIQNAVFMINDDNLQHNTAQCTFYHCTTLALSLHIGAVIAPYFRHCQIQFWYNSSGKCHASVFAEL